MGTGAVVCACLWTWSIYRYESFSLQQRAETLIEQEQKRSNALALKVSSLISNVACE